MDQWQHLAGIAAAGAGQLAVGWLGQHYLKGPQDINTKLANVFMLLVAFGFFVIQNHSGVTPEWFMAGASWSFAALGEGSLLSSLGWAAKTDSKPGQGGPTLKLATVTPMLLLFALALAVPAHAAKLLDPDRLNVTLGADFESHSGDPAPTLKNEFTANAHLRGDLTDHVAFGVDGAYGFGNQVFRATPDVRYRLQPGSGLAVGLGVDLLYGDASRLPEDAYEWRAEAIGAIPVWKRADGKALTVGVTASYGLESGELRLAFGPRGWVKQAVPKP